MKFVHIADVHFDAPFRVISDRSGLGEERRLEQRKAFKSAIEYAKDNKVNCVFISGDLYEQEYIRKSTIDYINNLFESIKDIPVYIVPGNHDPYINNSFYKNYDWSNNVKIFTNNVEKVENDTYNVYGYGFNDYEMTENKLDEIEIDTSKTNILLTHGNIMDGSSKDNIYNPIIKKELSSKKFDYVAIGHIHKRDDYYPGSLISLGFDELGEHGFIYGEINNKQLIKRFVKADNREFVSYDLDVSNINSNEDLIEEINNINTQNNLYRINLVGVRSFDINVDIKLVQSNVIKIKNNTKLKINVQENNTTLKGIFVKNLNKKLEDEKITQEQYEEALELGLKVLEK